MRIISSIILAISFLLPMKSYSQDIPLSLEDLIPGGKTFYKYRAEMPRQLNWYGDKLTYTKGDSILIVPQKQDQKPQVLTTLATINQQLGLDKDNALKSIGYVTAMYGNSDQLLISSNNGNTYLLNIPKSEINGKYTIAKEAQNKDFCIENKIFAYTKDNNIYIQTKEGSELAITEDTDKGIVNGQSAHRNEFGISKGTFWSPKGNRLAFYRVDETMVTDYPLVDISTRIAELKDIKYPMAGMKSHQATVGVYDVKQGKTIFLKTGTPKEKYLTNIAWSPDEHYIYIAELNRGQDTCILKTYNAITGNLESTLFTETHPKYVEPENPVIFLKNDSSKFLWASKRDGFNHLYLYDTKGKLIKPITSGKWDVTSVIGFDEKGDNLIYSSTEASPIEKHLYKINLKNGKKEQLSKESGVHSAKLSDSGKYIYDVYTSQENAGKVALTEIDKNKTSVFHEAKNPYRNVQLPEIILGSLKANDGETDLYYRLIKPLNFDPQKKYPVIVYVYGGPHSQLVDNSWMGQARGWDIYMAEKGYIVFTIDNRGTSNRGRDFENITHRQLGIVETQDQMTGIDFLKSQPYVDTERIGVHGWSYGGFMTLNLMLRQPETFKVGVAGGPVTDWKYYEIMYGERYMDSPKENSEGYKNSSMVDKAGDLKGRLMLIHGDEDPVVVMQNSLQFLKSSIKNRTHPDFFVYPGHEHNMTGADRVHLHEHITRYFDDFLK